MNRGVFCRIFYKEIGKFRQQRFKFGGRWDDLATDKQIEYLNNLVMKAKEESEKTPRTIREYLSYQFWKRAKLPKDLTKWEASGIIDFLKGIFPKKKHGKPIFPKT